MTSEDRLRARLSELSDREVRPLDDDARARIRTLVAAEGPRIVRRARTVRLVVRAGGATAAVALAVVLGLSIGRGGLGTGDPMGAPTGARPLASADGPSGPHPAGTGRACDAFLAPVARAFSADADGRSSLDLGARALLVAERGAEVSFAEGTGCTTVVSLGRGRVSVHAGDLGGGELRVSTPAGDVVVHGTIFAVEAAERSLEVEVVEGLVEVKQPERSALVRAGERIVASRGAPGGDGDGEVRRGLLDPARAQEILRATRTEAEHVLMEGSLGGALERVKATDGRAEVREGRALRPRPGTHVFDGPQAARATLLGTARERERSAGLRPSAEGSTLEPRSERPSETELQPKLPEGRALSTPRGREEGRRPVTEVRGDARSDAREPRGEPKTTLEPPPREPTTEELLEQGDARRRAGDLGAARELYQRAGKRDGATAEAAWIALARLELTASEPRAALDALRERGRRFQEGTLGLEAAWIRVRALADDGETADATREAERIVRDYPRSPQAEAARKWIREHSAR